MKQQSKVSFQDFLDRFPLLTPPISILENSHLDFSRLNDPLPQAYVEDILYPIEKEMDEYSEIVPCFRIESVGQFYGIVYWRAQLLNYDYFLLTYNWKSMFMDRVRIAGTRYRGAQALISVAKINDDWIIDMIEGVGSIDETYDTSQSRTHYIEILDSGKILSPHDTH